jgi:Holliday junction resolvase RusA-like endonuclease
MSKVVNVVIPVAPVPKGRPRARVMKGRVMEYTPAKTRDAEAEVRVSIRQYLLHHLQFEPEAGPYFSAGIPLSLKAMFVIPRPPSIPKKRQLPVTRPDCDNYVKLLIDSLNKFLWVDDAQLTSIFILKRYGMMPAIYLTISEDKLLDFTRKAQLVDDDGRADTRRMGPDKGPHLPGL